MKRRRRSVFLLAGLCLLLTRPALADDDILARIAAAGDAEKWRADVVVVLDHQDVTVMPNGLGVAREHRVTKILREGGILSQGMQRFPFDPHTNRLDLIALRVYRADGRIEEIPIDDPAEQPQPAWGIFWPTSQYLIAVPRLAVGDAVETITEMTGFNVAYLADRVSVAAGLRAGRPGVAAAPRAGRTFDDRNALGEPLIPPAPGHWHDEVHFWSSVPIIEKRYSVRISKDKPLQYEIYNGRLRVSALLDGDDMVYTFEKENIEPFQSEPNMESPPNVLPKLLLATLPTWEEKGRWLYELSEPHFAWDEAIERKVHEIIDGLETDEEKYTALNHWVAENIRYAGTSRGMAEGYTVHPSTETFHDRCGVCKDKAGLLVTMLRVAGYESYLVMTMARQRVDRVPADQFNHAVTCIRWPDGSLTLLDPTWMVKSRDNWSTLEPLQHVVYGLPEGKELSLSPYFPPEDCAVTWRARTAINETNTMTGTLDLMAVGAPEGRLRRALAAYHPDERHQWFDETFARLGPGARPTSVEYMEPDDFSGPLTIRALFEAEDYALGHGQRRFLKLPMMQAVFGDRAIYDLFGNTGLDERKYGIRLLATRLARFEETIRLPDGWKVSEHPEPVKIDGPSAGLNFEIEVAPGQIRYTCELIIKNWTIPPQDYANFKEVMQKFEELTGPVIACELEGGHAQR